MANYQGKRVARNRRIMILALVAAVVVMAVAAAVMIYQKYWNNEPGLPGSASSGSPVQSGAVSSPAAAQNGSSVEDSPPPYDFTQPAPEGAAVDNSYFDDAAFVGDSRTEGFLLYSGIGTGTGLTSTGLSIFSLSEKKALTIGGETYTLLEVLAMKQYGKVYLSLGVNELGYGSDTSFYNSYCAAVDEIRRLQPNAVIYVQNLIPLNEKKIEEYNGNKYNLTNEHLRVYNDLIRQVAEEKQVVYLDLYAEFVNEDGILPEDASRDGVHLKKEPCIQWLDYLKTHTVEFNVLYPDGPPVVETPDATTVDGSGQE